VSVKRALDTLPASATSEAVDLTDSAAVQALFDGIDPFDHLVFTSGEPLTLLEVASMDLTAGREAFELRYFDALGAVSAALPRLRPGGSVASTGPAVTRKVMSHREAAACLATLVSASEAILYAATSTLQLCRSRYAGAVPQVEHNGHHSK
jgi:hypothetical protein